MCGSGTNWWCLRSVGLHGSCVWVGDYSRVLRVVRGGDGGWFGPWFTHKESCDQEVDRKEMGDIKCEFLRTE